MVKGENLSTKKTRRPKRSFKATLKNPTRRICKENGAIIPSPDGQEVIEGCYRQFYEGLMAQLASMAKTKKTVTHKAVKLAFIGYMESLGVPDGTCQAALDHAEAAVQAFSSGSQ